jgi:glycosyltransferase involved in cell wall biosynthesis
LVQSAVRIVHVAPFYHPVVGGVEEVAKRVAEYMASRGHEVYVLTYNRLRTGGKESLPREEVLNDVHIIRLKPDFAWSHGTYSAELPHTLTKLRPDIVHVHVWRHPHVFQVAKLKQKLGKAILHTHAPFQKYAQLGAITWLYHKTIDAVAKGTLNAYDTIIALTPHEIDILTNKLGAQKEKIVAIPNGIDDEFFANETTAHSPDPLVLYIGRISRDKNLPLLVKAMKFVKEQIKDVQLIMVGPDEGLIIKLLDYAKRHDIAIKYLGTVSQTKKKSYTVQAHSWHIQRSTSHSA